MKSVKLRKMRLPGVEPGSIAWKAIILTVGLQTQMSQNLDIQYHVSGGISAVPELINVKRKKSNNFFF